MRNSSILKWANNKNSKLSNGKNKEQEKKWIHAPDTLVQGHVVYLVKVRKQNRTVIYHSKTLIWRIGIRKFTKAIIFSFKIWKNEDFISLEIFFTIF